ncbi:methyltransferase domain protein [Dictyocaulus viviparus]|uniref:Methyltransferase domain protein n=1 Tax=Dictyocaulus viviparus TaxID=29172 RepID=A0A0D8XAI3_DICVI|nr:methyltransferase domain protein [Dictyocaulus viviparus]
MLSMGNRNFQLCAYFLTICFSSVAMMSSFPKLILISFDGFRYDLLNETMTPNIYKWASRSTWFTNGSRSQYVTNTAPNHMSIVTGLLCYFLFPKKNCLSRTPHGGQHHFIGLMPRLLFRLILTLTTFWRTWTAYGNLSDWMNDVDDIVDLFLRENDPVNFVLWYLAEPDHTLHLNGFFNGELRKKIRQLDQLFGYFIAKFQSSHLENSVNIILTADHGHSQIDSVKNIMCVRDYITSEGYDIGDHMIYPHSEDLALELYRNISNAVKTLGYKVNVFLKEDVPARLFYSNSTRIGRIVIEPHIGWAASLSCTKEQLLQTYNAGEIGFNSSSHGMDPDHKEMRALLVISEVPNNIDLYSLMCHLLSFPAAPNNSSMSVDHAEFFLLFVAFLLIVMILAMCMPWKTKISDHRIMNRKEHRFLLTDCCCTKDAYDTDSDFLIPKGNSRGTITDEFANPRYWKKFFALTKTSFEWYGDYDILNSIFEKYLKPTDTVLQIGCGKSRLAEQMYDNGFKSIRSIDLDIAVIEEQKSRNRMRPGLVYTVGDATSLSFDNEEFSVVVDKGTLDALLPSQDNLQQSSSVQKMFNEVERVLKEVGRYLIVTLAQQHIVTFWAEYFVNTYVFGLCFIISSFISSVSSRRFMLRVHEVANCASTFSMPLFVFVAIKLRNVSNISLPIELCRQGSYQFERIKDRNDLVSAIISEQELSQFVHLCSRKLDREVSIAVESRHKSGPRYQFYIVDNVKTKSFKSYAVFVVPLGREAEWMFSNEKGRRALRAQIGKDRLIVVVLSRSHIYSSLQEVQDEIAPFFDILSCGSVDVRATCASGNSLLSGNWTVEDVVSENREYRRLIFQSSASIIQSEAHLKYAKDGKKIVDLDSLSCEHHLFMLAGLSIMPKNILSNPSLPKLKFAVLGLGGGILASFLLRHFPNALVDGIEHDPDVVDVAVHWFALPQKNRRMNIIVIDALDYLEDKAQKANEKLDALFVDLAGPIHDSGLSCPPAVFLNDYVLDNMKNSLKRDGMIALNLVTRDEEVARKARRSIASHFPSLFHLHSEEDVNEESFRSVQQTAAD